MDRNAPAPRMARRKTQMTRFDALRRKFTLLLQWPGGKEILMFSCHLIGVAACAQTRLPGEAPPNNLPAQKIGPNDLIAVSIYDSPEFTRTIRVGEDGQIRFPMLKRPINAMGLLPSQLEVSIRQALEKEDLIVDP